ncbi:hypothetical protein [Arundinibacter roseus]|uniref:Uncharacterized protein n=1 Tax=Arundinibacter roseus TaxID=2070510 RepID=A0A4R4K8V4_9BACT|nr:hypothetical protein [Arundinibacter roseus]TDB64040.1 hypothetical protein EZE20_13945 [Arundinibacter roseus]
MKNFEIKSKGTLSQYLKDNAIKAKGEIKSSLFASEGGLRGESCFGIVVPKTSKGLSVSL